MDEELTIEEVMKKAAKDLEDGSTLQVIFNKDLDEGVNYDD